MVSGQTRAVVIGAGVGGLASALRLRHAGLRVTLCDNHAAPGGKMGRWCAAGYCFDTGPTLLTMPHVLRRLFADLGEPMEAHLEMRRLDPHAQYVFADGTQLTVPADWEEWLQTVRRMEPHDVDGVERLREVGRKIYRLASQTFFRRHPLVPPGLPPLAALRHLPLRDAWGNYARVVQRRLRHPHLQRIYLRYPTYVGSSPYRCPATLLVIPFLEHETGVWFPRGGMYRIAQALAQLAARMGVELRPGRRVVAIDHSGGRVRTVHLHDGTTLAADVVVYTGDSAMLPALLGAPTQAPAERRSLSGVVVLLGLAEKIEGFHQHSVFFSADYREEFDDLFVRRRFPRDPTVYVHAPDDPELAPPGGQALYLMANAPGDPGLRWDDRTVEEAVGAILERLERSGLRALGQRAALTEVWHPGRMAVRFLAPGGSIYGDNSHGWRRAFLRPANRAGRPRGLYCAGGSFHPGGGVPMVLLSAEIAVRLVLEDLGR